MSVNDQEGAHERSWLTGLWRAGSLTTGWRLREHESVSGGTWEGTAINSGVQRLASLELWNQGWEKYRKVSPRSY